MTRALASEPTSTLSAASSIPRCRLSWCQLGKLWSTDCITLIISFQDSEHDSELCRLTVVGPGMIDQTTPQGKALQAVVKEELRKYLGKDYNDDVLPLYIVVMLAHGNQQPLVAENLDAFLGPEKAGTFAEW